MPLAVVACLQLPQVHLICPCKVRSFPSTLVRGFESGNETDDVCIMHTYMYLGMLQFPVGCSSLRSYRARAATCGNEQ